MGRWVGPEKCCPPWRHATIRVLTVSRDAYYTYRMHPLILIALVLFTALLWFACTVLMLAKLERPGRRAPRGKQEADRMLAAR